MSHPFDIRFVFYVSLSMVFRLCFVCVWVSFFPRSVSYSSSPSNFRKNFSPIEKHFGCTIHIFPQSCHFYYFTVSFSICERALSVFLLFHSVDDQYWIFLPWKLFSTKQQTKQTKRTVSCVAFAITISMVFICLFISFSHSTLPESEVNSQQPIHCNGINIVIEMFVHSWNPFLSTHCIRMQWRCFFAVPMAFGKWFGSCWCAMLCMCVHYFAFPLFASSKNFFEICCRACKCKYESIFSTLYSMNTHAVWASTSTSTSTIRLQKVNIDWGIVEYGRWMDRR